MAPIKRNRNRDHKNVVRRRGKNSIKKSHKYSGSSDDSRIEKRTKRKPKIHRLATLGIREGRKKSRMGNGRYPKMARNGNRGTSDRKFDSRNKSGEIRAKQYIRKALEFGLASGYLVRDENSACQVLRVSSDIMEFKAINDAKRDDYSDDEPSASSTDGRSRQQRLERSSRPLKRSIGKKNSKLEKKKIPRKRGRSRTKSSGKPIAQKRRRKLSTSRPKTKKRGQKTKIGSIGTKKNDSPTSRNRGTTDDGSADDEDEEPDPDNTKKPAKNNKNGDEKLPASSRPGSAVPDNDDRSTDGKSKEKKKTNKKTNEDETSEHSGDDATDEDDEEGEEEEGEDEEREDEEEEEEEEEEEKEEEQEQEQHEEDAVEEGDGIGNEESNEKNADDEIEKS